MGSDRDAALIKRSERVWNISGRAMYGVDMDLEKFFDTVNQSKNLS
jgi:hypothetical protein